MKLARKIVLIIPPQEEMSKDYLPSIGVGYLAAVLEKNNYEVKIIDSLVAGLTNKQTVDLALKTKPFLIGISANTHNRFNAVEIIQGVKKNSNRDIFTVAGGVHFSPTAEQAIANIPLLDIVVRSEGEETLVELVSQLIKNSGIKPEKLKKIAGLTFRDDNKIISTPDRDFIKNLDKLPSPAWHLFELDKYNARLEGIAKYRAIGVMSSRGCPHNCVFCANNAFWRRIFRKHSPERFIDEVEFLFKEHGFRAFDFWDDTITIFRPHIERICQEIINRKLPIKWYARARVDTVDFELLSLMKKAGCEVISFGVESGSERILKNIDKKINLKEVKSVAKLCKELDLTTKFFFMYSLPQETEQDLNLTLNLMDELNSYGPKIRCYDGITRIYPGTRLEVLAKKEGKIPADFNWYEKVHPTIPFYENKNFSLNKIIQIVRQRKREKIRQEGLVNLIKKGFRLLFRVRNIQDIKSLIKKFIELRIK